MRIKVVMLLIIVSSSLYSQVDTTGLQMVGKIDTEGNLKLRWFTESNSIWLQGLSDGYTLEKATYDKSKPKYIQDYQIVQSINTWSLNQIEERLGRSGDEKKFIYASMAYKLANSVGLLQSEASFEEVMEYKEQLDQVYAHAMVATLLSWESAKVLAMAIDIDQYSSKDIYRIRLNGTIAGLVIKPTYFTEDDLVTNDNYLKEVEVTELDEYIGLAWKKTTDVFASFVEHSEDGVNFTSNLETPTIQLSNGTQKQDSITFGVDNLVNGQLYYFKVYGYNVFGEQVLIGEVKGTPRDLTPPNAPVMLGVDHVEPELVEINWMELVDEDLAGFAVGRSSEPFGQYYQIHEGLIPKDWTSFGDAFFNKDTTNYYVVEAVDYSGNRSRSNFAYVSLTDSIPPAQPINITGLMDSIGIVTLDMEAQTERDFMGYRIYKANNPKTEFSVIYETYNDSIVANARNPILIDTSTIESLSQFVYYKVGALDYHYNESDPSEIIKVRRPDIYPPVSPMITGYKAFTDSIRFEIALSTSFDVKQNYIYRREASEEDWTVLDSLGIGFNTTYVDRSGDAKTKYVYCLKAVDEGGLESGFSNQLKLSILRNDNQLDLIPAVKYFEDGNQTLITWDYENDLPEDISSITILISTEEKTYQESHRSLEKQGLVVDTKTPPNKVTFIAESRRIQYSAIIESNIQITQNTIENDRDYKMLQKRK